MEALRKKSNVKLLKYSPFLNRYLKTVDILLAITRSSVLVWNWQQVSPRTIINHFSKLNKPNSALSENLTVRQVIHKEMNLFQKCKKFILVY